MLYPVLAILYYVHVRRTPLDTTITRWTQDTGSNSKEADRATDSQHRLNKTQADVPAAPRARTRTHIQYVHDAHRRMHAGGRHSQASINARARGPACTSIASAIEKPRVTFCEEHGALGADPGAKQRGSKFPCPACPFV
jgi:hypothetical protein